MDIVTIRETLVLRIVDTLLVVVHQQARYRIVDFAYDTRICADYAPIFTPGICMNGTNMQGKYA